MLLFINIEYSTYFVNRQYSYDESVFLNGGHFACSVDKSLLIKPKVSLSLFVVLCEVHL